MKFKRRVIRPPEIRAPAHEYQLPCPAIALFANATP